LTRNVLPALGAIEVAKLTRPKLEAWRAQLAARPRLSNKKRKKDAKRELPKSLTEDEKRRRRASTNRTVSRLVTVLNDALKNGRITANPMNWKIAPFGNVEVARAAFLTESQQRVFVTACGDEPDFQHLVLAGLHSGCRLGELGRLRVRDLVGSKTIYVEKSKSGKPRHVFLNEEGTHFFERLVANRAQDELLLLRSTGAGEQKAAGIRTPCKLEVAETRRIGWTKDAVKKPMRRACTKAEIPHLGFHQLRHSFATRLLMQGVPMKIVAQQLGQTSVRMLEKYYGHLVDVYVQQVIAAVPGAGLNQAAKEKRGNVVAIESRLRSA
jgi:integrase